MPDLPPTAMSDPSPSPDPVATPPPRPVRSSWGFRLLIWFFGAVLFFLFVALFNYLMRDLRQFEPVDREAIRREIVGAEPLQQAEALRRQIADLERRAESLEQRRRFLSESASTAQTTMQRILENQRLKLENDEELIPGETEIFVETQRQFLAYQAESQELLEQINALQVEQEGVQDRLRTLEEAISRLEPEVQRQYQAELQRRRTRAATVQIVVLLLIALPVAWLFVRRRGGAWGPILYPLGLAVLWMIFGVIHDIFPRDFFRYIVTLAAIAAIIWIIVKLLHVRSHPRPDWLLKQYKAAYEQHRCPVCAFTIRRGLYRLFSSREKKLPVSALPADLAQREDEPYVCPACGTRLFEECPQCHHARHALLTNCMHCGAAVGEGQ